LIIVSACLLGINCRYDGKRLKRRLKLVGKKIPVCPEQLGGLPTPRAEVIINKKGRAVSEKGEDLTKNFLTGAREVLKIARQSGITQAYLKSNSPSCGANGLTARKLNQAGIKVRWLDESA
jgi:uncharacterized protein YbbK (DUF523 family)